MPCSRRGELHAKARLSQIYSFEGLDRVEPGTSSRPEISPRWPGCPQAFIGDTLGDPEDPRPLPAITVEEPTISMIFSVNTSPLAGREGRLLTSRHIKERLDKEVLYNVSIRVEPREHRDSFRVERPG